MSRRMKTNPPEETMEENTRENTESTTTESTSQRISDVLNTVFGRVLDVSSILKGLTNIAQLPPLDRENQTPQPYRGRRFMPSTLALKNIGKEPKLCLAANGARPQYLKFDKLIAMVELMNDPRYSTVVLQNCSLGAEDREPRQQILGRILPAHSSINIVHGIGGMPIRDMDDIQHHDSFQVDRSVLGAYYLAAKFQVESSDKLDALIAAFEGNRFYELPTDTINPVDMTHMAALFG